MRCARARPGERSLLGADVIYNLAAVHRDDVRPRSRYWDVNVGGATNICDAADALGVDRIIFTSSVAIYGSRAEELDEGAPPAPFNDYGTTKLEAEAVHRNWVGKDPRRRGLVIVRPTVVFGEGNRGNLFTLIDQIQRGRFAMVEAAIPSSPSPTLETFQPFLSTSCSHNGLHIFNYVDKPDYTTRDLVRTVRHTGKSGEAGRIPYAVATLIGTGCDAFSAPPASRCL